MNEFLLRFPGPPSTEHAIGTGMHGVGRVSGAQGLGLVDAKQASVRICIDRRGAWLYVDEGRGVHVNGRPVRRLAMLRAGDTIFVDGVEVALAAPRRPDPALPAASVDADPRVVLRGVGGRHHGRSFTLERPRLVGRASEADIRLDDAAIAERHARLELHGELVQLRDLGGGEGSVVNGQPVRDAVLRPGDQLAFDGQRFVVEAPGHLSHPGLRDGAEDDPVERTMQPALAPSTRRLPWLLLAALLIAAALSALLLFGSPA